MAAATDPINDEISIEALEEAVQHPDCGADLIFVGRVRGVYKGQNVQCLEYEAYEKMAIACMRKIAAEAKEKFRARVAMVRAIPVCVLFVRISPIPVPVRMRQV